MKNYVVIRMVNKEDGSFAAPVSSFEEEKHALKEFFRLCGLAVDSTHITDTVCLLSADGVVMRGQTFNHPVEEETC